MMIRSEDKNNFTWVHNTFIRDRRLSMAERGLLLTMMSMPENWSFSVTGLRGMVADGRDRVRSTVKALEEHGYLKRVQTCDENGLFNDVLYTFSDEPVFIDAGKLSEDTFIKFSAETDKKDQEKPDDSPISENPPTGAAPTETHSINNNYSKERLIYEQITMCCTAAQRTEEEASKPVQKKKAKKTVDTAIYAAIIEHLNSRAGTNYKPTTKETQKHINARLNEGYTLDDFKAVIDRKCSEWLGTHMAEYLRPSTLFGNKFEGYLTAPVSNNQQPCRRQTTESEKPRDYSVSMIDLLDQYQG